MRGFEQLLKIKKKKVGQVASEGKWPSVQSDPIQLSIFSYFLKRQVGGTKPCHHGIVYKPDWIQSSWYLHSFSLSLELPLSHVHTCTRTHMCAHTLMHTHARAHTCTRTRAQTCTHHMALSPLSSHVAKNFTLCQRASVSQRLLFRACVW